MGFKIGHKVTFKHGESGKNKTPEYRSWAKMHDRCYNPKQICYDIYGGRGIVVCSRWRKDYRNFLNDMGRKPSPIYQIDRINTNGNYEPKNCRWATPKENSNNRRKLK